MSFIPDCASLVSIIVKSFVSTYVVADAIAKHG